MPSCSFMSLRLLISHLFGYIKGKSVKAGKLHVQNKHRQDSDSSSTSGLSPTSGGVVQEKAKVCTPPFEFRNVESQHVTQQSLESTMHDIARETKDWKDGHYTFVKTLQQALRNQGCVDLMWAPGSEGPSRAAVKRMPNRWIRSGPDEFQSAYPSSSERPWFDMAIVKELNKLGFPYVCELLGVFRDEDHTFVATSLATDGDLFTWCEGGPKPGYAREDVMQPIASQIFVALRWLHELGIAHRDLSLENILLTETGGHVKQVKVIDFGMSTLSRACRREVRGKQSYQAPEMHLDSEYDPFLSDCFAVGVVLFAMAVQDYPWTSTRNDACQLFKYVSLFGFNKFLSKRKLRKGNGETLDMIFSPAFIDLLGSLLEPDPKQRNSLGEAAYDPEKGNGTVFSMKWLNKPRWEPLGFSSCRLAGA